MNAESALTSVCEGLMDCLNELQVLHLAMDGPEGTALGSNDALIRRLRKAHLHVQSVTSWEVGRHVLHGMAADIRAAQEQLDPLVVPKLTDRDQAKLSGNRGRYTSERDRALKVYCHPGR